MERIIRHDDRNYALMEYRDCFFEDHQDIIDALSDTDDPWKVFSKLDSYLSLKYEYLLGLVDKENVEFDVWMFANHISNFSEALAEANYK